MMYRRPHIHHNLLSLFVVCSAIALTVSYDSYASNSSKPTPLKVYIPSASTFITNFTTDKLEYSPDTYTLSAKGNVEIEQNEILVRADVVEYNQMKNTVNALGDVAILEPSGKVTFVEKIELKHEMKQGLINKFKAQMVDNDVFMEAEARKSRNPARNGSLASKQSFVDKVLAYITPVSMVASDPRRLAQLAPAAGGDPASEVPLIGNVPLIRLSEEKAAEEKPATSEVKSEDLKPLDPVTVPQKVEEVKPAVAAEPLPPVVSTPAPEIAVKEPEEITKIVEAPPEEKTVEKITKKPAAKKLVKLPPKEKNEKVTEVLATEAPSEPGEALSPKSRELLEKVSPSIAPKKTKPLKPLKVDHTKDMQDLFKADEALGVGVQSEALGVKVGGKAAKVNIDYELERAYNATISGQSEAAMLAYQAILDNAPNNTQALFGLATMYHRARQFDKARPLYSRLLTLDPQHRDGFNNFLVLLADEAPREALIELEKLETKNPGFSTIPAQIAVIYQKLGESDKAIGKMFRAVALAPENLTYRYNLAIMLDKQKNYDEAAKLYRQLIEASERGEKIPGNISNIQQRLTFISSNRP